MFRNALFATTALAAGLMLTPAMAVDVGAGVSASGSAGVSSDGVSSDVGANSDVSAGATGQSPTGSASGAIDTGTTAATSSEASFGTLISSINNSQAVTSQIETMTEVNSVTVVEISSLQRGQSENALQNALSRNANAAADLQAAINANSELMSKIDEQSVDVSSVIAAEIAADGGLTLFVE